MLLHLISDQSDTAARSYGCCPKYGIWGNVVPNSRAGAVPLDYIVLLRHALTVLSEDRMIWSLRRGVFALEIRNWLSVRPPDPSQPEGLTHALFEADPL